MFVDLRSLDQGAELDADLCVIGGGAAGITLARSFAGTDLRVLLIESGGFEPDEPTQDLYRGREVGVRNNPLARSRLRYFGGTTNHWHGWCARADPLDLTEREWIPNSGWPLSFEDLAPYYDAACRLLGLDVPSREDEPASADQGDGDDDGDGDAASLPLDPRRLRTAFWQIDYPPTRFGETFRRDLEAAENVRVVLWGNAVHLARASDRAAVDRVELRSLSGRRARARARRFVLACGALENARLLLVANAAPGNALGNDHGLVGSFFMDHFQVDLGPLYAGRQDRLALMRQRRRASGGAAYRPGFHLSEELQREERVANAIAFLGPRRRVERQDPDDLAEAEETRRMLDRLRASLDVEESGGEAPPWDGDFLRMYGNPIPDPASQVRLGRERDALGLPRLDLDWRLGPDDRRSVRLLAATVASELLRVGVGRLRLEPWLRAEAPDDDSWLTEVKGAHHPMGTTRMATDPRRGVTDADGRVHGVENLYVAGSSLFPTAIRPNPTLTIVALALRLADHLARGMGATAPSVR